MRDLWAYNQNQNRRGQKSQQQSSQVEDAERRMLPRPPRKETMEKSQQPQRGNAFPAIYLTRPKGSEACLMR
ncbi:hypothetical protein ACLKA6_005537 [Drosophila palustris]